MVMGKECQQILSRLELTDADKEISSKIFKNLDDYFATTQNECQRVTKTLTLLSMWELLSIIVKDSSLYHCVSPCAREHNYELSVGHRSYL